jgi:hypothetical protein
MNFKINKNPNPRFYVVDDFYESPSLVRDFALQQAYYEDQGAVGLRTSEQFLFDGLKERFEEIIGREISEHNETGFGWYDKGINGRFQSCKAGVPSVFHCDTQKWAGVIYLTPDAPPQAGTSFYRHKETKIRHSSEIDWERGEGLKVFNQHTFLDASPYERVDMVGNVFNRLVIFDGNLIHSGHDYFGWDIASSRLFQIFFFD